MHAALPALEIIYYLKQWDYYLIITKAQMSQCA